MGLRDFSLLMAVCLVWGLNVVLTRWVVSDFGVPPVFYAGVRFALVGLCLLPLLWPIPKKFAQLFIAALCMGGAHFALLFIGLANATASSAAVVGQLGVPFSTILSIIFLGERIHWRRGIGIVLAFMGVLVIALDPNDFSLSTGLIYIAVSAFFGAVGGVLLKRMVPLPAVRLQAWVGAISFLPLFALSALTETGGVSAMIDGGWPVWLALAFSVLGVSIFGHGAFYVLLKRHELSLIAPLTLMTPIWGVIFGILLLSEPASPKFLIGAVISLSGVLVIALRPNRAQIGRAHV